MNTDATPQHTSTSDENLTSAVRRLNRLLRREFANAATEEGLSTRDIMRLRGQRFAAERGFRGRGPRNPWNDADGRDQEQGIAAVRARVDAAVADSLGEEELSDLLGGLTALASALEESQDEHGIDDGPAVGGRGFRARGTHGIDPEDWAMFTQRLRGRGRGFGHGEREKGLRGFLRESQDAYERGFAAGYAKGSAA